jgi:mannose-6-phosphate isomerase-like protein (cupin superfamily)
MSTDAVIVPPGGGEPLGSLVVKVARPELTLFEYDVGGDFGGTDLHFHRLHADAFYVLSGTVDFLSEDGSFSAKAGAFAFFPPGAVHGFAVGPGGARFLNSHTPGGFERYLEELLELRGQGGSPDAEFYARHDIYYV